MGGGVGEHFMEAVIHQVMEKSTIIKYIKQLHCAARALSDLHHSFSKLGANKLPCQQTQCIHWTR